MDYSFFNLSNKVAIVTGASRGIGKEIAIALAKAGADVVISSRKLEALKKVSDEEISIYNKKGLTLSANIGRVDDLKSLVEKTLMKFGKIDILINNAAINPIFGNILDTSEEAWDKIMDTNLKGTFILSQLTAKSMIKQGGGAIVNITSTAGIKPAIGIGVYGISKSAIIMLTKTLSHELSKNNIRVNAVAPGLVKTQFSRALWENDFIANEILKNTPLGRFGKTEDIASAVLFLASDYASYITGQTIIVDGGLVMST